jgi:hypothetical protein
MNLNCQAARTFFCDLPKETATFANVRLGKLAILTTAFSSMLFFAPVHGAEPVASDESFTHLVQEARKLSRDYLIESAVMTVRLDDVTTASPRRTAEVEIVYTIFALNTVTNFDEEYHSPITNAVVSRIRGSLPESALIENSPDRKSWNVPLQLQPSQRQTLMTGAKYVYPAGVPARRSIHEFHNITPAEDVFCYPNSEDVIGDLTIRIESPIPIKPPQPGDALLFDPAASASQTETPALYPPDAPGTSPFILVGHWRNVTPNQVAELKISR